MLQSNILKTAEVIEDHKFQFQIRFAYTKFNLTLWKAQRYVGSYGLILKNGTVVSQSLQFFKLLLTSNRISFGLRFSYKKTLVTQSLIHFSVEVGWVLYFCQKGKILKETVKFFEDVKNPDPTTVASEGCQDLTCQHLKPNNSICSMQILQVEF